MPVPTALVADLQTLLGDRCSTNPTQLEHHGHGESWHAPGQPDVVVFPVTTEEVSEVLRAAARHRAPVVPFGAGSSLEGHVNAIAGGISIDMSRMNRVVRVSADDLDATVEAGVTHRQLNKALANTGMAFWVDPGADATIGGMAATRASGTTAVRYGTMRETVLGLTVVLATGQVIRTGGRARKSSAGYDLTRLFVGSEGTLGVITEVTVRLHGHPEAVSAAVCAFESMEGAVRTVITTIQLGIPVARIELMDEVQIDAVNRYSHLSYAIKPTLLFEFHGTSQGAVTEHAHTVQEIAVEHGGSDFRWATTTEDRARLWQARHNTLFAALALRPGAKAWVTDVCVPISTLAECILDTRRDLQASTLVAPLVGHVGDGNFHLNILVDPTDERELAEVKALNARLIARALALGGTCTGEHGIGLGKMDYLVDEHGDAVEVMKTIKRALDPDDRMNPGKMFRSVRSVRLQPDHGVSRLAKSRKSNPSLFDLPDDDAPGSVPPPPTGGTTDVALHEAAQSRYLNYALSVITSRALPDVRDGLKPVQRRILYTMWQQNLTADTKHRKCAKVVGDVMGSYHPHGDAALYETLVRMAQSFSLRYPLVDGSGNFGSLDGDSAAAMRYTECRLARLADEMLEEIDQRTVPFRPNYDGTKTEPVVLPARIPNLLVNGTTGIAVGMATNVPPHHLGEICTALVKLLDNPDLSSVQLCRYVKGPDFPTGGQILNSADELKEIYRTGSGTIRLRATWEEGPSTRTSQTIYVTSIPYATNKSGLVERIADVVLSRKLPPLVDVRDVSTDDVRIELELKKDADPRMVMAYLFKNTPLQTNIFVNLTCLIPTENPEVGRPERLDLKAILWHFLHFRLEVVTNRLEHELEALTRRVHILEGFEKVFDALDEIIRIIRKSEGKADSAEKIMKRFDLDAEQTDAILELKLYRLARLEILVIQNELADKRKRARQISGLLKNEDSRWKLVRDEIEEVQQTYGKGDKRRTIIESVEEVAFTADDFIVDEDNVVIVSRDGWVKRQKEVRDLSTTRLREGDGVLAVLPGSTRASVAFFTNLGVAYTARIIDVPASTGYGEPVQKLFKLRDGERVIAAFSLDPRVSGEIAARKADAVPPVHALAVTSDGYSLRFSFESFVEPSTRSGRRYARPSEGVEVVGVARITGSEIVIAATQDARAILCRADEVNYLSGPGKGVILLKLQSKEDRVLGFLASTGDRDIMRVETSRGAEQTISTGKYEVTGRGGKGRELLQRGQFTRVLPGEVENPQPLTAD